MSRIFLIGFMGSGKSTLGKELAKELGYTFIETDKWIEQQEGRSISQIFSESGEEYFRQKEIQFLIHLQLVDTCIVATGGGMPCTEANMTLMNQLGTTIWLDVDEGILVERLEKEKATRPLLSNENDIKKKVAELLEIRKPFYNMANITVTNPTIDQLQSQIVNLKSYPDSYRD